MSLEKIKEEAILPTPWGKFILIGFKENTKIEKNHVALIYGKILNNTNPILVRVHSECLTGDALFSLRCDCGFQLKKSMKMIASLGKGIIIYHRQEGRNIGLLNKIKAYSLQDTGLDTVEANHKLGFLADERNFSVCADILNNLNIKDIFLLTNNPLKVIAMKKLGINVIKRVSLIVGRNINNSIYLDTKEKKMGHCLKKNIQ
ncbi:GTP cyclohydrolase-2 [Buchnera aphidicola (Eriosoma grossulariae)]|uniref:GTP cyclohydrolase II n=1 Tax=Buchnera aphidicola TaxID=9 RepID=UPI003463E880